jgi:ATP-dependent Lon protease
VKEMNEQLLEIKKSYVENAPSISNILRMTIPTTEKCKLLEKLYNWSNSEILTNEYNSSLKNLLNTINKETDEQLVQLEHDLSKFVHSDNFTDNLDYKTRILKSAMSFENKAILYKKYAIMETYEESDSSEYAKYKNWIDTLLSVPFGKYIDVPCIDTMSHADIKAYISNVRNVLDKRLSFLETPKDQIINMVTQMIRNPNFHINAIGLYGSRGTGKTNLCKSIAESLGRPFRIISLGGESDASTLTGHSFTYVGSNPGRIIEILKETKCMNPVVLVDELDKVSETQHGKEIIGNLIHLTDSTTNNKYNYDRYFSGVEFDLSKVLFIFTYNDPNKVDKILADRLFKIKINNYTLKEKLEITNKHLIHNILDEYRFASSDVLFEDAAISYIVESSKSDEGMREIKRKFEIIASRVNTLMLTDKNEAVTRLKYKCLYDQYIKFPVLIKKEHIDILLNDSLTNDNEDKGPPFGMYI